MVKMELVKSALNKVQSNYLTDMAKLQEEMTEVKSELISVKHELRGLGDKMEKILSVIVKE